MKLKNRTVKNSIIFSRIFLFIIIIAAAFARMFYGGGHLADNRGHCDLWRRRRRNEYYVKDHWGQYGGRFCCIRRWKLGNQIRLEAKRSKNEKKTWAILQDFSMFLFPPCLLTTSSAQSPEPLGNYNYLPIFLSFFL